MKQKISRWNHLSIFFFGLSSGSLFGIPFLNLEHGFSGIGVLPVRCLVGVGLDALDAICSGVKEPVLVITGVSNSLHLLGVGLEGRLSPS